MNCRLSQVYRRILFSTLFVVGALLGPALAAQESASLQGRVVNKDEALPVEGATVAVEELNLTATTDADGRYTLALPAGTAPGHTLEVRANAPTLSPQNRLVELGEGVTTLDFELSFSFSEEITVGSRAPGTASEKATPIEVYSAEEIEAMGFKETSQVIQALSASFNFPRPTTADGSSAVRPATLRGLGPDQVLVLINGKRRHTTALVHVNPTVGRGSSGVDLNAIPVSAIAEITLLRDGAAAQYGSDAIAGVINIALKAGPAPLVFSTQYGETMTDQGVGADTTRDGQVIDSSLSYGWNLLRGWGFATVEWRDREGTNRAGLDARDQVRPGDANNNAVAQPNHWVGDSDLRDVMAFFNAQVPVNEQDTVFFYTFGGYSQRDGTTPGLYRRGIDNRNQPAIYPLGFLPLIVSDTEDIAATFGLRGDVLGWSWDLSGQYGTNEMGFAAIDTLNTSLGPTVPPNQTDFEVGTYAADQALFNFDIVREVAVGALAGPLNVALGLEYRREGYEITAGEPASYIFGGFPDQFGGLAPPGAQVLPGIQPANEADASRNNFAAYVDLEGDVTERLRIGVAGRFEDYSDFGSTSDGKLTVRFAAHPRFVLRAATSTGFRAPSLVQSHYSSTTTVFANLGQGLVPLEVGTFPVDSPQARALGATDLRPEESFHWSGGFAWNPVDPFELTADYYSIDIDDRIVLSGNFTGPRIVELLRPFGASSARFFTDAIDTETRGYDLTANYRLDLRGLRSVLLLGAAYNKTETDIVRIAPTPPQLAGLENVLFDRAERSRIECSQPADSLRLSGDWRRNPWQGVLRVNRYGEYCFPQLIAANEQTFGAQWITDLEASYTFLDRFTLSLGALNLFDVYPETQFPQNSLGGILRYSQVTPYGVNGRTVYGRLTFKK
jgi:iron complex outermembrane recepter protein